MCIRDRYQRRVHGEDNLSEDDRDKQFFEDKEKRDGKPLPEIKFELVQKRTEPEKDLEESKEPNKGEEVSDEISDSSDNEPKDFDLLLGQYDKVQRTKGRSGNRYRCVFTKVILRVDNRDYVAKQINADIGAQIKALPCLLYTSPSPRDLSTSRMPSSA
eukprot:TRINITY_DN1605_c0_g1_i3.p3 TRINITY_DN1605_c0_g1~~TRINITY_DN1605_c0_g1_i3.p3  ORF type:complete len:159 (-),score=35.18 TRINITY_DN1605_c0_g1_i3:124-600(-)